MFSLPGMSTAPHYGFSLTPGGSPYLAQSGSSTPHQGVSLNMGSILYLAQSGIINDSCIFKFVMDLSYRSV